MYNVQQIICWHCKKVCQLYYIFCGWDRYHLSMQKPAVVLSHGRMISNTMRVSSAHKSKLVVRTCASASSSGSASLTYWMFTAPPRYFEDPFKPDSYLYNDSVGYFDNSVIDNSSGSSFCCFFLV